jgi:hypothetical protein
MAQPKRTYRNPKGSTELNSSDDVELQFGRFQNTHSVLDNVLRDIFDWPDIVFVPKGVIKDQIQGEPENVNTRAWRELMKS